MISEFTYVAAGGAVRMAWGSSERHSASWNVTRLSLVLCLMWGISNHVVAWYL